MDDIDRAKALAALEQLEAEKARRLQAKIDSGEVVSVRTDVVVHRDEDVEEATARAIARHPIPDDGRHIRELFFIYTGVPRRPDYGNNEETSSPQITASSKGTLSPPDEAEPAAGVLLLSRSQPVYVRVTIRNGDDNDPGQIAEAYYTVEDGAVILRDADDKHITSRALLKDEDPLAVARALLREAEAPKDFARPIRYPKLGLA